MSTPQFSFNPESGYPGFEDLQDVMERLFLGSGDFFSLNQDVQDLRIYRM
jgi:hypothetical protein